MDGFVTTDNSWFRCFLWCLTNLIKYILCEPYFFFNYFFFLFYASGVFGCSKIVVQVLFVLCELCGYSLRVFMFCPVRYPVVVSVLCLVRLDCIVITSFRVLVSFLFCLVLTIVLLSSFWRSQLIWICTICHSECEFISTIWIKEFDWLKIWKGRDILIYSAGQGLIDVRVLFVVVYLPLIIEVFSECHS